MGNTVAELTEQQDIEQEVSEKKHRSKSGFWIGIVVLLVILAIVGIGFYLFSQLRTQQENLGGEVNKGDMQMLELTKQISGYQTQLAAIQTQLATLDAEIKGKDNKFTETLADTLKTQTEKMDNLRSDFNLRLQQVQRQLGKTRGDWLIADAEYLLSVANQRLQLMGDINTTREALEAADQRLRESGDGAVYKVREQILKDLTALKKIVVPDMVGTYAAIRTLQDQVVNLAHIKPYAGKKLTSSSEVHSHTVEEEKSHDLLAKALKHLEGVVTVRHTDQPIAEILTPEEAEFIRQQLRIKLEMMKIALVQENSALFKSGLEDARSWLLENFTKNSDARAFTAELDRLNKISLRSEYPDISLSLKTLRDVTKLRLETDKSLPDSKPETAKKALPAATPEIDKEKLSAPKPATTQK